MLIQIQQAQFLEAGKQPLDIEVFVKLIIKDYKYATTTAHYDVRLKGTETVLKKGEVTMTKEQLPDEVFTDLELFMEAFASQVFKPAK